MIARSTNSFDVVVIGGGPAGSAAAFTAARGGLAVCVVDKSEFPRDKLCGGLVTQRSKNIFETVFGREWDSDLFTRSDQIRFFQANRFLAEVSGYSTLYFTMRRDFDAYLLKLAGHQGARLELGTRVREIDLKTSQIQLANGNIVSYRFLIGADGVNSGVAKLLFGEPFTSRTIGFGLEVEVPRNRLKTEENIVEIDFGAANWGYGWVFPKKKTLTIGVGGISRHNKNMKEHLSRYLSYKKLGIDEFQVKGQFIPFGDFRATPGHGNVMLCGDAAGVVDPITGEGIAYAMQSGRFAADAVVNALRSGREDRTLEMYFSEFETIARSIRQSNFWRYFIFPEIIQKPFAWAFADAGTLQRGYLDILAGKREYNDLLYIFPLQVLKGARKIFRNAILR